MAPCPQRARETRHAPLRPLHRLPVVARFRRSRFLPVVYGAVAASLALVGFLLRTDPQNALVMEFFYVMISVLNLFMLSVFWGFLLEIFAKEQTKRLFGVIAI